MAALELAPGIVDAKDAVMAQARLRAILGIPVALAGLLTLLYKGVPLDLVGPVAFVHFCYVALMLFLAAHPRPFSSEQLAFATAILDPLIYSAWILLAEDVGVLVVGLYLFTILGFGFRTGPRLMLVCQVTSIIGFSIAMLLEPFWQQHLVVWSSFLIALIVVPLYAVGQIRKLHEARGHAERESQAKSQLLAKVSHEPDIADARSSVTAQAKVRAMFGIPIMVTVLIYLWYSQSLSDGARVVTILVTTYIIAMLLWAARPRLLSAKQLLLATAILDPLMISAWVSMVGEVGGLAIGFYLFNIIGFGLRTGRSLMLVCQAAAIFGFTVVFMFQPYWSEHQIVWFSYLVTLVLVPLYAMVLVKKLHEARGHAERESQAKSQLLAKVSHELRTPLSGIVAAAQLLLAETEDKRVAGRAETIMGLSKDLLSEINDLLDQAKYEARALVLESTLFELRDQMERLRLILEPIALRKDLAFVLDMDPRITDRIQGDSHRLSKVLINLAGNAVKFTEKGKVEIAITLLDKSDDQYRIRFSVQDTGIGIPKEMHARIFEPFFQADSGTARKYGGTGLGMTIAKEIVNLMGGDIQVDSSPGAGSHFHFDLDFRRVKAPQRIAGADAASVVCGKRVLVVDDNMTNLMLFKELLLRDRHEVVTAHNGADALEALSSREFDVIFLDFNMEDMDGATVLQIYRFGRIQTAPAFFLTADTTAATAAKLRDTGAAGVLHKPISAEELRQAIAQVCGSGPGPREQYPVPPAQAAQHTTAPSPPPLAPVPTQYIDHRVLDEIGSTSERPEFLADVLDSAITDIERNVHALTQAIAAKDFERMRNTAHALKGVCSSIGATRLETIANRLMRAGADDMIQHGARLNADVIETSRHSVAALRNAVPGRAVNG